MPGWRPPEAGRLSNAAPPPRLPEPKTRKALGITSWRPFNFHLFADRYNAKGDGNYYDKLVHAYDVAARGVPKPSGVTK